MPSDEPSRPYNWRLKSLAKLKLYNIKKKTSFWHFKYFGVSLLGIAVGVAGFIYGGTKLMAHDWRAYQNKYGVSEAEAKERVKIGQERDIAIGVTGIMLGGVVTITVPIVMNSVRFKERSKMVGEYNMREFGRLYEMKK